MKNALDMKGRPVKVGDRVALLNGSASKPASMKRREKGIVVHLWTDEELGPDVVNAYVAFFGLSFPKKAPKEKPYILRYFTTSLEVLDTAHKYSETK